MNQELVPTEAEIKPDGPIQGPHMLLDQEGIDAKRSEMPLIGNRLDDTQVQAIHQLDEHRQAVADAGWNPGENSTYTQEDHVDDLVAIKGADTAIRQEATNRRNDEQIQDTLSRVAGT